MAEKRVRDVRHWAALALALCLAIPAIARADEAATKGREILGKWSDAVVALKVVVKMRVSAEGRETEEEEQANETKATVIDPSGLVVSSLATVDPSHIMEMMGAEDSGYKVEAEVSDLKIRLSDGKEIPAKIVLRDKDLDLAYVRPTDKLEKPLTAVSLADSARPAILDEIVVLSRLGEVANRAPYVCMDRILAIVEKPRTLFVPGISTMMAGLGCPVFTLDGKAVGILVVRSLPGEVESSDSMFGRTMPVIIPASDVTEGAKQAAP